MGRRLILDTTTLIAYERGRFDTTQLDDDDLAIAAVTVAATRRAGRPRGAHDVVIAAHAAQDGRTVLSLDARARFADLPGVRAEAPR